MSAYDSFYANERDTVMRSANVVAPIIHEWVRPRSVVDVGCGTGAWLAAYSKLGVPDILGFEGEWIRDQELLIPAERVHIADVTHALELARRFDLAVCLEVAEHLPAEAADRLVSSLAALSPVILFSAAVPDQGGPDHVNEQWPEYWARRFRSLGFIALDCVRPRIWNDERVAFYYAQNAVLYATDAWLTSNPSSLRTHIADPVLPLIHPGMLSKKLGEMRAWTAQVASANAALERYIPAGSTVLLLDGGALQALVGTGYARLDADWASSLRDYPQVDAGAYAELAKALAAGAYVTVTWSVFWWLECFPELATTLRQSARIIHQDQQIIIYQGIVAHAVGRYTAAVTP